MSDKMKKKELVTGMTIGDLKAILDKFDDDVVIDLSKEIFDEYRKQYFSLLITHDEFENRACIHVDEEYPLPLFCEGFRDNRECQRRVTKDTGYFYMGEDGYSWQQFSTYCEECIKKKDQNWQQIGIENRRWISREFA